MKRPFQLFPVHPREDFKKMLSGFVAGACANVILQPLEVIKTQILVNPRNLKSIEKAGQFSQIGQAIKAIYTNGDKGVLGITNFYQGSLVGIIRQGMCFSIYSFCLDKIITKFNEITFPIPKFIVNTGAVVIARSISTIASNPFQVIKTRKELLIKKKNIYKNSFSIFKDIITNEGIRGFFKGTSVIITRELLFQAVHFNLYRSARQRIKGTILPSFIAGFTAMAITQPIEVVRNRMMVKQKDLPPEKRYKNLVDGLIKIMKNEGYSGFFKGYVIRSIKRPLTQSLVWAIFETLKKYQGVRSEKF